MKRSFLGPLLSLKVPVEQALAVLARHDPTLVRIAHIIHSGIPLSTAMSACPEAFDPTWTAAVRAGEEAGDLGERFVDLARYDDLISAPAMRPFTRRLPQPDVPLLASIWVLLRAGYTPTDAASAALLTVGATTEEIEAVHDALEGGRPLAVVLLSTRRLSLFTSDLFRLVEPSGQEGFNELLGWLLAAD